MNLAEIVYWRIADRIGVTLDEFISASRDFSFIPFEIDGNLAAIVMQKGSEVHVISTQDFNGRGLSRRLFRSTLARIADEYGKVTTRIANGHESGERLATWLGFRKISDDGFISTYLMDKENDWCKQDNPQHG